jgi:hypothetical protein
VLVFISAYSTSSHQPYQTYKLIKKFRKLYNLNLKSFNQIQAKFSNQVQGQGLTNLPTTMKGESLAFLASFPPLVSSKAGIERPDIFLKCIFFSLIF